LSRTQTKDESNTPNLTAVAAANAPESRVPFRVIVLQQHRTGEKIDSLRIVCDAVHVV
jgi:hypothetical protein